MALYSQYPGWALMLWSGISVVQKVRGPFCLLSRSWGLQSALHVIAARQQGPNGLVSSSLPIPVFLLGLVLPPLKAGREESQD